jgi:hypothetical protein
METVSDNKGGRGRPPKYEKRVSGYLEEFVRYESDPVRGIGQQPGFTVRQQQNIIMAERAADRISREWEGGGEWAIPRTVLTELGRIEDDALFDGAVSWYFQHGHNFRAHDAAKVIRRNRLARP